MGGLAGGDGAGNSSKELTSAPLALPTSRGRAGGGGRRPFRPQEGPSWGALFVVYKGATSTVFMIMCIK